MHKTYDAILLPKNSMIGLVIAVFAGMFGFGMIWHMWWLLPLSLLGIYLTIVIRSFARETEYLLPAAIVEATERKRKHT